MVLLLRGMLQFYRANYFNPVSQAIVKLTDPVLKPIQTIMPVIRRVDFAVLTLVLVCELVKLSLMFLIQFGALPNVTNLVMWSVGDGLSQFANVLFYLVIIRVILSWVQSPQAAAIQTVIFTLTEPMMRPVQRLIPPVGGLDLSALVLLIVIQFVNYTFFIPLTQVRFV